MNSVSPLCNSGAGDGQPEPEAICLLSMTELIPGLQPLVLWMANSIELLHFIQHEVPLLLPWTQHDAEQDKGTFSVNTLWCYKLSIGLFVNLKTIGLVNPRHP